MSARQPVAQEATSPAGVRAAVRHVLLVFSVVIKVKPGDKSLVEKVCITAGCTYFRSTVCVFQDWHFQFHVKEGFIAPVHQQINIPVQRGLMGTHQAWLKNGSAHRVTPGCTVKEQVKYSQFISVASNLCLSRQKKHLCIVFFNAFFNAKGGHSPMGRVLQGLSVWGEHPSMHQ